MSRSTTPREDGPQDHDVRGLRSIGVAALSRLPPGARRSILHAFNRYAPWEDGFDTTPPVPGIDEVTGPPDFVGIGAQKAGTTWWYEAICAHPEVFSRSDIHKERHFFGRYVAQPFGRAQCQLYRDWFPRPPGRLTGEWTPDYMHVPWVPPLLAEAAPATLLLVMLRDPIDRFRSGLAHQQRDRARLATETYQDAFIRGLYHDSLRRWSQRFPRDQILVLQYERCVADPGGQIARTYRFLGLEPFELEGLHTRVNTTSRTVDLDEDVRRRLVELYTPDVTALSKWLPELDMGLWPNFADIGVV